MAARTCIFRSALGDSSGVARAHETGGSARAVGVPALLRAARAEPHRALDADVRGALASRVQFDFAKVRVHDGVDSARAADRLGARAFTIGGDVHLGAEARALGGAERAQLLAHEAVHAAQQGGERAALTGTLDVSHPHDSSEVEAGRIAAEVTSPAGGRPGSAPWGASQPGSAPWGASQSAGAPWGASQPGSAPWGASQSAGAPGASQPGSAPWGASPSGGGPRAVSQVPAQVHRDLKGAYDLAEGRFHIDMTTQSNPGGKNGMSGTLSFRPNEAAPDAGNIRLLQIIRFEDLVAGGEYNWTGAYASRSATQTTADAGRMVTGGFHVDHDPTTTTPRTASGDARVSPFYRSYWPNVAESHDGWKHGDNIRSASLWDFPGHSANMRYSLETYAVAAHGGGARAGHVFGGAKWGFTISNAAAGTITDERVTYHDRPSSNYYASLTAFNEYFQNPGSSRAP